MPDDPPRHHQHSRAASTRALRRLEAAVTALLVLLSAMAVLGWVIVAIHHAGDRYMTNHVVGAWLALAAHAQDGTLYPALFDGQRYGGTRFMAIPILLLAGVGSLTGNLLLAGKLISYTVFAALMGLMLTIVRGRLGCRWPLALFFTAALLCTPTGWLAATSIRFDSLPVVLQLVAIALIGRRIEPRTVMAAGLCCALAVLCKLSAIWAIGAIGLWLVVHDRRMLACFIGVVVVGLSLGAGGMHVLSDGRAWHSFTQLSFAGVDGLTGGGKTAVKRAAWILGSPTNTMLLAPIATVAALLAALQRTWTIYHTAWLCCLAVTMIILSDVGAESNHLIDFVALSAICTAALIRDWRVCADVDDRADVRTVLLIVLLYAAGVGLARPSHGPLQQPARVLLDRLPPDAYNPDPFSEYVRDDDTLLAEDPYIPVSLGRLPIIGDPWMLRHIAEQHPEWVEPLHDRIAAREFDWIILMQHIDERPSWYERLHLGSRLAETINEHYEPVQEHHGDWLYRPRERRGADASSSSP